ncbi:MAG: cytidine deaminase [Alkalispirochaeta sp.]|jgi:homotetrameric cytidine deaminase
MKKPEETYLHAKNVRTRAYTPYSRFKVGAALHIASDDTVIEACNVENVSYGATVCAERNAVFAAVARYGSVPADYMVLVTDSSPPAVPCALCLQVLQEFLPPEFPIHLANLEGIQRTITLGELLPVPFDSFTPAGE